MVHRSTVDVWEGKLGSQCGTFRLDSTVVSRYISHLTMN